MALPVVIAKNQTGSPIFLPRLGLTVPASPGTITLTDFASFYEIASEPTLETNVASGDIVINDGTSDLSAAVGVGYLDATGNLNGPTGSLTANTLPRLDGTTGRYLKSTGVVVDASNNLTGVGTINGVAIADPTLQTAYKGGNAIVTSDSTDILFTLTSGGFTVGGSGNIAIGNGAGAQTIEIGTGAGAKTVTLGSVTGGADTTLQAGAGDLTLTAGGLLDVNAVGIFDVDANGGIRLDSSAGTIGIGTTAQSANIYIGTGAAARSIDIGNSTGTTPVTIDTGTSGLFLGTNATAHPVTAGSTTGASATTIQAGTGAMTFTAGGIFDVNATGALTLDSSGGAISIGSDANAQAINIGTGAAARTVTIGNGTGATSVAVNGGTGAMSFGANVTVHSTTIGSVTGASATTIQSGTGNLTLTSPDVIVGTVLTVPNTGLHLLDTNASHDLIVSPGSDLTADRTLTLTTGDVSRTVNLTGAQGSVYYTDASGNLVPLGPGTSGQVLRTNGAAADPSWLTLSGSGDVVGPGSATDNAVARFDGTTGKLIQNSVVTLGDTGVLAGITDIDVASGTLNIGANATAHTVTVGSVTGASATTIQSGSGLMTLNSGGILDINSAGIDIDSSAGIDITTNVGTIDISTITFGSIYLTAASELRLSSGGGTFIDAGSSQNLHIGTLTHVQVLQIGSGIGATSVDVRGGTGAMSFGANAVAHDVTIGSVTGAAATLIQSGTGAMTFTAGSIFDVNSTGQVTIDSSGSSISIGSNANNGTINVGTGAAARNIVIGNVTGATAVEIRSGTGASSWTMTGAGTFDLVAGTGAVNLASNATVHSTTIGSVTSTSATTIRAGTGALTLTAGGIFDVNAVGAVTIDGPGISIDGTAASNLSVTGAGLTLSTITSGTLAVTSAGALNLSGTTGDWQASGALTLDSSGGAISIGSDANAQAINVGTGAAARQITIGNVTGATAVDINAGTGSSSWTMTGAGTFDLVAGTGAINLASNATDHSTLLGSTTGTSATTIRSGTGNLTLTSPDVIVGTVLTVPNTGLHLLDTNASHDLIVSPGSDLTADRTLTLTTGDVSRTVNLTGAQGSVYYTDASGNLVPLGPGTSGQVLRTNGAAADPSWLTLGGGSGDVVGPGSATDNALVRFDTTTGKLIQNSVVTLGDTGVLAGITDIDVASGTLNIGVNATVHDVNIGSATGVSATSISSGSGGLTITGTSVEIQAGTSGFVAESTGNIYLAVTTGTFTINGGTGAMSFGANATVHSTTIGSVTGASATTIRSGTGDLTLTAGGNFDLLAASKIILESSAGTEIGIGIEPIYNVGVNVGTGGTRAVVVGSVTSTSATTIRSGTGNLTLTSPDVIVGTVLTVPNTGLHLLDTNASHDLIVSPGSDLTSDRTLTLTTGDVSRTVNLTGAQGSVYYTDASGNLVPLGPGTSGQVLRTNGAAADPSWLTLGGGSGDVVGPGSATDNALVRFDTTTGKLIQNSGAVLDDSNNLTGLGYVDILAQSSLPAAPSAGSFRFYGRTRASRIFADVETPNGRDYPLQPFLGVNRVVMWLPETSTTIRTWGMPVTNVGTVSTPALASTNLSTSMRRWRVTSAATANSAAENRSAATNSWRGNAAGLGGFTLVFRFSLLTLPANHRGFFGYLSATGATSTSQVPSALTNCLGFAWDSADTNLFFQHNDGSGTATRVDLGANFPNTSTTAVYTCFIYAAPNGSDISYRCVREDTGDVADGTVSTDLPANTTFLTQHLYMNNGGTASACAFECSGVYIESDY